MGSGQNVTWRVFRLDHRDFKSKEEKEEKRSAKEINSKSSVSHAETLQTSTGMLSRPPINSYHNIRREWAISLRHRLSNVFLPQGYPNTVYKEYAGYMTWQFLNSVSGTITFTLSTQALLQALGMAAGTAIGLAATTNWIVKDGFGLFGGVLYAGFVSNRFDSHPKKYRFFSSVAIQFSSLIEVLTPLVPHLFLPMASLANVCKNISWLAAGATRAAMHRGLTRVDNLGDLTAKAGAQGTFASLVGTGLGIALSMTLGTSPSTLITAFVPLCAINLFCAYRINMSVVTRTLNVERAELLLKPVCDYIARGGSDVTSDGPQSPPPSPFTSFPRPLSGQETEYSLNNLLPNAEQVSVKEKFILPYKSAFAVPLDLEPNIDKVWSLLSKRDASLQQLMSDCLSYRDGNSNASAPNINADGNNKNNNYRILILPSSSLNTPASVTLWYFDQGVDTRTILRGFYHACIIRSFLETCPNYLDGLVRSSLHLQIDKLLEWSASCVQDTFSQLATRALQDGWDLDHTHLSEGENGRIEIEI